MDPLGTAPLGVTFNILDPIPQETSAGKPMGCSLVNIVVVVFAPPMQRTGTHGMVMTVQGCLAQRLNRMNRR